MLSRMLFKELVRMKNTLVWFMVIFYRGISFTPKACTATVIMADQIST